MSVIRSPEGRAPPISAHDIPVTSYAPSTHRLPKHKTGNTGYPPPAQQPLPHRLPPVPPYTQQNTRAQVIRGVYSRPSHSSTTQPTDLATDALTEQPVCDTTVTESGGLGRTDKSTDSMSNAVPRDESQAQDLTKPNGTLAQLNTEMSVANHHAGIISPGNQQVGMLPPSNPYMQQPIYMNGFQGAPFNSHAMVPPMGYPPSGYPGLPSEFGYSSRPPVHMVRAPNGQMFYRYAQPRMPMPPQVMSYPTDNPMYPQMPFIVGRSAPFAYPTTNQAATSPKRKRKKTSTKTVIESHSAVLARPDNEPDTVADPE